MTDYINGDGVFQSDVDGDVEILVSREGQLVKYNTLATKKTIQTISRFYPETAQPQPVAQLPLAISLIDTTGGGYNSSSPNSSGLTGGKAALLTNTLTPEHFTVQFRFTLNASAIGANFYPLLGTPTTGLHVDIDGQNHLRVMKNTTILSSFTLSDFGIDTTAPNSFHEFALMGYGGGSGLITLAIDGKFITADMQTWPFGWPVIVFRGVNTDPTETNAPRDTLLIREITLFDYVVYSQNYTPVSLENPDQTPLNSDQAIGYYKTVLDIPTNSNDISNRKKTGFPLRPPRPYQGFGSLHPWANTASPSRFTADGLSGGVLSLHSAKTPEILTAECEFRAAADINLTNGAVILNSAGGVWLGLGSGGALVIKQNATGSVVYAGTVALNNAVFHRLAITSVNGLVSVYLDGVPVLVNAPLTINLARFYLRGNTPTDSVVANDKLVIRNFTVSGYCKYYGNYNPALTPQTPTDGAIGFYPLSRDL